MNFTRMNCIRDAMFGIAVGCVVLTPLYASAGDNPCPRPAAGGIVAPPPTLASENGALNLAFDYFTTTDSANRTLFCFVKLAYFANGPPTAQGALARRG